MKKWDGSFQLSSCVLSAKLLTHHLTFANFHISEYEPGPEGRSYKRYTQSVTWYEAKKICENDGAILASDDATNIHEYLKKRFGTGTFWIGANDIKSENTYVWANNKPINVKYWGPNQPGGSGDPDCVRTNSDGVGRWNDAGCHEKHQFLCQKDSMLNYFTFTI